MEENRLETTGAASKTNDDESEIPYAPTRNKISPTGHKYEIYVLLLSLLRAKNNNKAVEKDFFFATEAEASRPYDDIVFFIESTIYFLQLKYSNDSTPIQTSDLVFDPKKEEKKNKALNLWTFYESYREIKKKNENVNKFIEEIKKRANDKSEIKRKFVLFTNRPLHEEVKGVKEVEDPLFLSAVNKLYKVENTEDPAYLYQQFKKLAYQLVPTKTVPTITDEEIAEFFENLYLASNQPNIAELRQMIHEKLKEMTGLEDTEWISNRLKTCVEDWAHKKESYILRKKHWDEFFAYVPAHIASQGQASLTMSRLADIDRYKIFFKEATLIREVWDFLNDKTENKSRLLLVYYEDLFLTKIKLTQAAANVKSQCILSELSDLTKYNQDSQLNLNSLQAFCSKFINCLLVTVTNHTELKEFKHDLREFVKIFESDEKKKIVMIIPMEIEEKQLRQDLKEICEIETATTLQDRENSFLDLTIASQNELRQKIINYRLCELTLDSFMDAELEEHISGSILTNLIKNNVNFGMSDDQNYDQIQRYYIERQLFRRVIVAHSIRNHDSHFSIINDDCIDSLENLNVKKNIGLITTHNNAEIFNKLCEKYKNVSKHWFVDQHGLLLWQKSQGTLIDLNKYVLKDENFHKFSDEDFADCSEHVRLTNIEDVGDKVVIITALPGMGKSSLLSHIAAQSINNIERDRDICLIKTNLKDPSSWFYELLEKGVTKPNAAQTVQYLCKAMDLEPKDPKAQVEFHNEDGKISFEFNKQTELCKANMTAMDIFRLKLFTYFHNKGNIVLLLDGFDETAPEYNDLVLSLLMEVKKKVHRMWITTRPYNIADDLSGKLDTFPYSLTFLSEPDYIRFFEKHSGKEFSDELLERLQSFFKVFKSTNVSADGHSYFLGIPLHLEMLATIYSDLLMSKDTSTAEVENLTMSSLYEKFFRKKFSILYPDAFDSKHASTRQDKIYHHGEMALMELFEKIPEEVVSKSRRKQLIKKVMEGSEKTGIVDRVVDGRPRFVHRTYAEYFAGWLLAKILKTKDPDDFEATRDFVYNMITEYTSPYRVVFKFLNFTLVSDDANKDIFNACINGKEHKDAKIADCFNRTPRHLLYCSGNFCVVDVLQFRALSDDVDEMYVKDKLFGWTPMHYAAVCHDNCAPKWHSVDMSTPNDASPDLRDVRDVYKQTPVTLVHKRNCTLQCKLLEIYNELRYSFNAVIDDNGTTVVDKLKEYYTVESFEVTNPEDWSKMSITMTIPHESRHYSIPIPPPPENGGGGERKRYFNIDRV